MEFGKTQYLISTFFTTSSIFALCPNQADHPGYSKPPAVQPAPCAPVLTSPCEDDPKPPACTVLCDAGPRTCNGSDVYFSADFLLWTPRQDGLEFAMSGIGTNTNSGNVYSIDFGAEFGFKVGLGYDLPYDGWDIFGQFTWIHGDGDNSTSGPNTSTLYRQVNNAVSRAKANWAIKYNVIDLELAHNFFVSKYLKIRPFAGFKGTWQSQDYNVYFTDATVSMVASKTGIDQSFWGFGPRGGLNTAWHFMNSLSLIGDFAISALWSGYDVERHDTDTFLGLSSDATNTHNNYHTVSPVLELLIGLRFESWFYGNEYHIAIDAGWEEQIWWGHNRYVVINQPQQNGGTLSFHGLTFKVRFDF